MVDDPDAFDNVLYQFKRAGYDLLWIPNTIERDTLSVRRR
jgi:hypothetical protein